MPTALLFPGQNSRYPEMFAALLRADATNSRWLDLAGEILGRDLRAHFRPDNSHMFTHNRDVQVGVFLANHLHWQTLERQGLQAEFSAGLSLGEYNHLVHIGALEFEEALRLVNFRGEAYEASPCGLMTAVYPVAPEEVETVVEQRARPDGGMVAVGMYNTPRQCVLSGTTEAVTEVSRILEEEHYAQSTVIESRLPMHSPLFRPIGESLRGVLEGARWRTPRRPYLPNVTGVFLDQASPKDFVDLLARHTFSPVRWRESMESLCALSPEIGVVETGPGSILSNLFGRKWLNPKRYNTDTQEALR